MKHSFSFKVFDSYNKINLVSTKAWGSINPFTSYWAIKRIAEAIDLLGLFERGSMYLKLILLVITWSCIACKNQPIDPNEAEIYYHQGLSKFNLEEHEGAVNDFTKAININPNHADAYYRRGLAYYGLGKAYSSLEEYYGELPNTRSSLEQYQEAVNDFTKAIKINPNHADAYYGRGLANTRLGRFERGVADYTKAININPNHAGAYYERGFSYFLIMAKYQQAQEDVEKSAQLYLQQKNEAGYQKAMKQVTI